MNAVEMAFGEFSAVLARAGLREALGFLNARIRHRYTGLYRFDPPMLRAVCVFDRENPTLTVGGDSPIRETYCSLVAATEGPVLVTDAANDSRVATHAARESFLAYCGVPVRLADGQCVGSLCHFDVRPRIASGADIALLELAAGHLATELVAALAPRRRADLSA